VTVGDTPVRRWVNPAVYLMMVLMFGSSFAVVHVALGGMTGIQVGIARVLGGTAVLGAAMLVVRPALPRGKRAYFHLSVMGLTSMFIPHFAFAIAQGAVSSGLAAIYNSAAPLVATLLAAMFVRDEPLTPLRVVGGVLGFFSVVLLVSPWDQGVGTPTLIAHLLCLLGALGFAASVVYFRVYIAPRRIDPLPSAFFAMVASLVLSLALLPFAGPAIRDPTPIILFAVLFLCLGPSGIGPVWNARLLRAWGPVRVSSMGYLMPVIAVVIGVLVLGETMRPTDPIAALLILVSVLLVQLRPRPTNPLPE
jgi:drug/metabolite transporter (DMT)-like permease